MEGVLGFFLFLRALGGALALAALFKRGGGEELSILGEVSSKDFLFLPFLGGFFGGFFLLFLWPVVDWVLPIGMGVATKPGTREDREGGVVAEEG